MILAYTNAGDASSVVLNQFRQRALQSIGGAEDNIGYFEWSAPTDDVTMENAAYANPAVVQSQSSHTVHRQYQGGWYSSSSHLLSKNGGKTSKIYFKDRRKVLLTFRNRRQQKVKAKMTLAATP
jgi:hypothetical protein